MSELDKYLAEKATGVLRGKWNKALGGSQSATDVEACEKAIGTEQDKWSDDFGAIDGTEIETPPGVTADSTMLTVDSTIYTADIAA